MSQIPQIPQIIDVEPQHPADEDQGDQGDEGADDIDRRRFLHLVGASLALGGLAGCTKQPAEHIAPYVHQPEGLVPGRPLYFATAMTLSGAATGLLVQSREGRPVKIEGNPDHPASLGATDVFAQASLLDLYDPDRSQAVQREGAISGWPEFLGALRPVLDRLNVNRGAGLRVLSETVGSPTLAEQRRALLTAFSQARWHCWEPVNRDAELRGARLAFGTDVVPLYRLDRAERILALDADFLSCGPASLRHVRDFARGRRAAPAAGTMSRLYAVETTPSPTGEVAEHRLALRPSELEGFARAVAAAVGAGPPSSYTAHARWIAALARDLQGHRGRSLVIAGRYAPPAVHALSHAINHALGAAGSTVSYAEPPEPDAGPQLDSLRALCRDLDAGRVDTLVFLGGNPAYTAPADLDFAGRLRRARLRIHLGPYFDETAALCQWHVPQAHYLEAWSDARAFDGTVSIVQPLIAPLYGGRSAHELLAAFGDAPERSGYEIVRGYWRDWWRERWQGRYGGADFEALWRRALDRGVVPDTALPAKAVTLRPLGGVGPETAAAAPIDGLEVVFRPDPGLYDGRFNNNGWLQEKPRPLDQLTWDNVAAISPRTAARLGLGQREAAIGRAFESDVVELRLGARRVHAPVWVLPGQPDECVTLTLGYGRTRTGRVGADTGYNAYLLRTGEAPWHAGGLALRKTGTRYLLASAQTHFRMEGRGLVRSATLEEYRRDPGFAHRDAEGPSQSRPRSLSMYPEHPYKGHAWGMAIDLGACVGCGACVVACQAENNIPVVGKTEVARGREMHWLRVDHYYQGAGDNPAGFFEPVPCMHCEHAPCELVCPVAATVHSAEGLNDMVYNRCVGTRYCSNNCPYKVRRFNFFRYQDWSTPSLKLLRNPEVSVRSRGVMEKCTYCVQRITAARVRAEEEGRGVRDGEVVTACQAACPAEAIVFGDINDRTSRVARLKAEPRNYALLGELNTRPRTTYLAAVRNPNPELPARGAVE